MKRESLTPAQQVQLSDLLDRLHACGMYVSEEAILDMARKPIVIGSPREPHVDKLRALLNEWEASPKPRNRHERRKAAALSRRS